MARLLIATMAQWRRGEHEETEPFLRHVTGAVPARRARSDSHRDPRAESFGHPGPVSISLRNVNPDCSSLSISRATSVTCSTMRFHLPPSCRRPSGIGREPDAPGPLSSSLKPPRDTVANAGNCWCSSLKPRYFVEVYFGWSLPHKAPQGGFMDPAEPGLPQS